MTPPPTDLATDAQSALQEEIGQTRPFASLTQEATLGVMRTADVLRHAIDETLEPHGLTHQQYNVLRILRGSDPEPLRTMEIAERMVERTPGITRLLDRLEAKGLVERRRGADDRRCVFCSITPVGLSLLARLDEPIERLDGSLLSMLDPDELRTLIALLDRVRAGGPSPP